MNKQNAVQIVEAFWAAVWQLREDGKLVHNWVERASWEVYNALSAT